jgi:oxygen-independent coproporphyrinogen III oxidase
MQHSIYLHIPFCTHRCAYCDFNTYAGLGELIPTYVDALCREVALVGHGAPPDISIQTVFFGGGTPSLLSAEQVERVLTAVRSAFRLEDLAEVTLESNPGTVTLQSLEEMHRAGINRISLGVQSANGEELRMLERTHDFRDVLRSVSDARRAGIDNLNLDLIYGLPEQSMASWRTTLRRALELQPKHISAYCLTLEHGTPFGRWAKRGLMPIPDGDLAADMYEWAHGELVSAGYEQYEISNWARPGYQCRHNLQYWRAEPYFGFGAGAHGYAEGYRYSNVLAIREYTARLIPAVSEPNARVAMLGSDAGTCLKRTDAYPCSPAALKRHCQTVEDEMAEQMIMGLRLTDEGVHVNKFEAKHGKSIAEVYARPLAELAALGLIETVGTAAQLEPRSHKGGRDRPETRIRLTRRGRLLGNRVFAEFLN